VNDSWENRVDEAVDSLAATVEVLAQERASIEAVLYSSDRDDEWKANARLEYELSFEGRYLERAIERLRARLTPRHALVDEQMEQRRRSWDDAAGDPPADAT
jgi:hypothetical protein